MRWFKGRYQPLLGAMSSKHYDGIVCGCRRVRHNRLLCDGPVEPLREGMRVRSHNGDEGFLETEETAVGEMIVRVDRGPDRGRLVQFSREQIEGVKL